MPGINPGRSTRPITSGQRRACLPDLKRRVCPPVAMVALVGLLWTSGALAGPQTYPPAPGKAEAPTPQRGGTLRYIQEPVTSLDPKLASDVYSCTVANQIHRGLLQYSNNLSPVPGLARTWTISRDGMEYTFELQPGVHFHHGRELTAEDVVYSLERIFEPDGDTGLGGQYLAVIDGSMDYHSKRARGVRGLSALSRYSVRIRLTQPSGSFLWALAMVQASVLPRDVVQRMGSEAFGQRPVGCGPFQFVSQDTSEIRMKAFPGFFRGRANLDSLIILTPQTNATTLGAEMLLDGSVDMAEIPGYRRREIATTRGLRLISRRELSLSFVGVNQDLPPLDNLHVRRALAFATDRTAMLAANPEGHILPVGILPPGMSCYSPELKVLPFSPDSARLELAAAGYPGGKGLATIRYVSSRSSSRSRKADSLMVAGWQRVGLPIKVEFTDWAGLSSGVDNGRLPLFSLSWVADIPDPDTFLGALFTSQSPYNYFHYRDHLVDSLLSRGRVLMDPRMRGGIYKNLEKRVLAEAAMIPLFNNTLAFGVSSRVHGLDITPLGISCVDFSHVWMETGTGDRALVE